MHVAKSRLWLGQVHTREHLARRFLHDWSIFAPGNSRRQPLRPPLQRGPRVVLRPLGLLSFLAPLALFDCPNLTILAVALVLT